MLKGEFWNFDEEFYMYLFWNTVLGVVKKAIRAKVNQATFSPSHLEEPASPEQVPLFPTPCLHPRCALRLELAPILGPPTFQFVAQLKQDLSPALSLPGVATHSALPISAGVHPF